MKVEKVLNNSLILTRDDDNRELIVMGKGLGFNSRPGDDIIDDKIEKRFVVQENVRGKDYLQMVASLPEDILQMAEHVLSVADQQLENKVRSQILFTLADHLAFAVERHRQGIVIQNRLLHEVQRFYPAQYQAARQALDTINLQYGLTLPDEEAGNIAFHLVNGQSDGDDVGKAMQSVKMLKDIFTLVQYHFQITPDYESLNYSRFLTHIRFFIQRLQGEQSRSLNKNPLTSQLARQYPDVYRCTLLICEYVKTQRQTELSEDEQLWLMVHLVRLSGEGRQEDSSDSD